MKKNDEFKLIAKLGYFSLAVLVPLWHLWLSPPPLSLNPWLITSIWFLPLLYPLKGLLRGDPYTYAWCGFLALFYVTHAIVIIYSAYLEQIIIEVQLAIFELIFASLFFIGSIYYAKYRAKELGLNIDIRKDEK